MRGVRVLVVLFVLALLPVTASAGPVLRTITPLEWQFALGDGSVRTVRFGTSSSVDLCMAPGTPGVTDGSSNTIRLGETQGVAVTWASRTGNVTDGSSNTIGFSEGTCLTGIVNPTPVDTRITDGSSNTISFGEGTIDLRGRAFEVCFSHVQIGSITDGTSNTILFSETSARQCYEDAGLAPDLRVQVPAPATLTLTALSIVAWVGRRRRR